jgi:hypothetical protein
MQFACTHVPAHQYSAADKKEQMKTDATAAKAASTSLRASHFMVLTIELIGRTTAIDGRGCRAA